MPWPLDPVAGSPERQLWAAVVIRGLRDALGHDKRNGVQFDASWWLKSSDFDRCCELAGLCPRLARQALPDALDGITIPADQINSDIHGSAEYRAHLVIVMAKRAVAAAG